MRPVSIGLVLLVVAAFLVHALPAPAAPRLAVLEVTGMVCPAWPISVKTALERLPGVTRAEVSLERGEARVEFDDATITADQLAAAVDRLGFRAKVVSVTDPAKPAS